MKLLSVDLKGYKNISHVHLNFDKMTILVAENSYGKSNVMTGIDFAIDFLHYPQSIRKQMMGNAGSIPLNSSIDKDNFQCEFFFDNGKGLIKYGYEFVWEKDDQSGSKIIREWLDYKENGAKKFSKLINRNLKGYYKSSVRARCSTKIDVADSQFVLVQLMLQKQREALFYYDILEDIYTFSFYVEHHLDKAPFYMIDPILLKDKTRDIDIQSSDNIAHTIFVLKKKHRAKFDLLINAFKLLFPDIEDVQVEEFDFNTHREFRVSEDTPYTISNKMYSLYVNNKNMNQPLDFKWLSDGAKRIFLMLSSAVVADITNVSLIAFEEPENSIHPSLLQNYLDILNQLTENTSIILASHSPYILQYVNTSNIYIGKPNKKGLADFAKIADNKVDELMNDAVSFNFSLGDYIFSLLSGGDDDSEILLGYLEK